MLNTFTTNFEFTSNAYKANTILKKYIKDTPIGCDFETASKYSEEERNNSDNPAIKNSHGLSHPSIAVVTHLSIAVSPEFGFVFINDNKHINNLIFNFLVNTEVLQIYHNAPFDLYHILYNTGRLPKRWECTRLLAKARLNHADSSKALVGLKKLQGHNYGKWSIADEIAFTKENMYNPAMLQYAAIDAMACLNEYLTHQPKEQI